MLWFFVFLFIILPFIAIILIIIALSVLRRFFGRATGQFTGNFGGTNDRQGTRLYRQNTKKRSKIIDKSEGEYVDFDEIK